MRKNAFLIGIFLLLAMCCLFGNSNLCSIFGFGKTKKIGLTKDEQEFDMDEHEAVISFIVSDHPLLWEKFRRDNYSLAISSPQSFIEKLSIKNAEWIVYALENLDKELITLSEKEINTYVRDIARAESEKIYLDMIESFHYSAQRLKLSETERVQLNKKLFANMVSLQTKDALQSLYS